MLPCTWLVAPRRTFSVAMRLPWTLPSIEISEASMSALTCPLAATVTRPLVI